MIRSRRFPRVLALALVGLAACNNEEKYISLDKYIAAFTTDVCDSVVACNCEYDNGSAHDHCVAQLSVVFESVAELNEVDGLSFDGECAEQSLDELGQLGCGVPVSDPFAGCVAPCKLWYGPMTLGGSCEFVNNSDNCQQGLVCGGEGVCVDPCAEPDLPMIGQACAIAIGCIDGAYCDNVIDPVYPTCVALPAAGQPCAFGSLCNTGLVCDDFTAPANPVCAMLPGVGEECLAGSCASGLYCDFMQAPSVCATLPTLGEACPLGVCDPPYQCGVDDVCVEPPPAVCGYYDGLPAIPCAADEYTCDDGSCIPSAQVCDTNLDCGDGSDEDPLLCGGGNCAVGEFECADTSCIPGTWECDGVADCTGAEDEAPINPNCP
jgi:hypothetical protein